MASRTDAERDADRERFNAALATGDPDTIETTRRAVLDNIFTGIMADDDYQGRQR